MLSKCNFTGSWEQTQFGRETVFCVTVPAKNTMNGLIIHGRNLAWNEKASLSKSYHKLRYTRGIQGEVVVEPHQHTSCQFCAAGRRGPAQVCSSAYCSLAWVNNEKTGAIRRTCQAWNSLLMFTPFTLGLSQRCCLSLDFWQAPTAICFLVKANKQFQ